MLLYDVLESIRGKKKALELSTVDSFYRLTREVASNVETVDASEAAQIIEQAGKSEHDFEADVSTQLQRLELVEQLAAKRQLERDVVRLVATHEQAQHNFNEAVARLSAIASQAYDARQVAELALGSMAYVESKLRSTVLDPSLRERKKVAIEKRMAIVQKRRPLADDLQKTSGIVGNAKRMIDTLENRKTMVWDRASITAEMDKHEKMLRYQTPIQKQLSSAVAALDSELRTVDIELADIEQKELLA